MGKALSHNGKIITFADPPSAQRATAKTRMSIHRATRVAARDEVVALAKLVFPPTQDPKIAGALWNNNGVPAISAG